MDALRTFVGLPLPESYRDILRQLRRELEPGLASRLTWARPEQFHLTLKFLGPTPGELLSRVAEALAEASQAAPVHAFQASGGGFFPPRGAPRVLWAGLGQGLAEARKLARAVDQALAPLGFAAETRPFAAHLTLARIKEARRDPWDTVLARLMAQAWPIFEVAEMLWWKSEPGQGGHKHSVLERFPLKPAS